MLVIVHAEDLRDSCWLQIVFLGGFFLKPAQQRCLKILGMLLFWKHPDIQIPALHSQYLCPVHLLMESREMTVEFTGNVGVPIKLVTL